MNVEYSDGRREFLKNLSQQEVKDNLDRVMADPHFGRVTITTGPDSGGEGPWARDKNGMPYAGKNRKQRRREAAEARKRP